LEVDDVSEKEKEETAQDIFLTDDEGLEQIAQALARRIGYLILVTPPRGGLFLKHISLISLQEFLALLILVLTGVRIKKQLISLDRAVSQDELDLISNKINYLYSGHTWSDIPSSEEDFSPLENRVVANVVQLIQAEEAKSEKVWASGFSYLLSQPEFSRKEMLPLVEVWEEKKFWEEVLNPSPKVKITIGHENEKCVLHNLSLVVGSYTVPRGGRGTVGVVGPTRMYYQKVIPWINFSTQMLSYLLAGLY
jgi:heat-inducible transcriptional repressor